MDLLEYQGKQLFAKHGIAVPSGEVADHVEGAVAAAERIGYPCAIKAQVLIGGRGKAGGSRSPRIPLRREPTAPRSSGWTFVAHTARGHSGSIRSGSRAGSAIAAEYYASVILDRGEKKLLAMFSARGGMDIEAVAAEDPEALVKAHIDPTRPFDARRSAADRRGRATGCRCGGGGRRGAGKAG